MYGIRWLPAVLAALVACAAVPDAHAQTWLRWSKATPVKDPAKQTAAPKRRIAAAPTIASVAPSRIAAPLMPPPPEPKKEAPPVRSGPSITIIEEPRPPAQVSSPVVASVAPPAPSLPPSPVAVPSPAPSSPPVPMFAPPRAPAIASPVRMDDVVVQAAPLMLVAETVAASPPACSDCPTQEELQATSAAPVPGETPPEDRQLQSELKRRLLQGQ